MYDFSTLLCAVIGDHPNNSSRRMHKFKFVNFEQEPQLLYEWPRYSTVALSDLSRKLMRQERLLVLV